MGDDDLGLRSTDDLIAELFRRFDHAVFTSCKIKGSERQSLIRRWSGHDIVCLGLCDHAKNHIHEHVEENSDPGEMDDV